MPYFCKFHTWWDNFSTAGNCADTFLSMMQVLKEGAFHGRTRKREDLLIGQYHRGLSAREQERVLTLFESGEVRCVIGTVAFGLGLDVTGVRNVFLHGLPRSPAEMWQMIGRSGRDGLPATAHLLATGPVEAPMQQLVADIRQDKVDLCLSNLFAEYFGVFSRFAVSEKDC